MRRTWVLVVFVALAACGGKKEKEAPAGGSAEAKPVEKLRDCPPANVVGQDGECVVAITPEKVEIVVQQKTRLDELATLLEKVEVVKEPIALLNALRELDQWKALTAKFSELAVVDQVVVTLDTGVKKLGELKASLGEASTRLGNLKDELDRFMRIPATKLTIIEIKARVTTELAAAIEPLAKQTQDIIQNVLPVVQAKLGEWNDLLITACTVGKAAGGDKLKELCGQAKDVFGKAVAYVKDLEGKPAKLFEDVTGKLETSLEAFLDEQSKKLIDEAQTQVNAALKLPPQTGSGSAGSATK